ncbi:S-adenosyl-L-methionine-dependent methyltransferases superfamily protein [Striga hermonthica]|uniref:S-adenosyl-L-methionine-dependent methyltransferases superfamily protein n=1 Tax=Striga hermonthica TaxID=68872 RepID=A0A9N7N915_STRHE|nr:S-adenosyl-L-methionine-dependent methyltransferases superfamily protein [Striga hermonthica]
MADGFCIRQLSGPGVYACVPAPAAIPFSFPTPFSRIVCRYRASRLRRLVLGIGFSLMAAPSFGPKSFMAYARQKGAVDKVLENVEWPEQFPFKEEDFQRFDETPDIMFYESPRFVTHIDDPAIAALTKYYSEVFPPSNTPGVAMLDMCSSWVSHYPKGYKQSRIAGMGLNEEELNRNPVLTEYVVQDLNVDPKLPFKDNTFDVITNVVSVDYLTKPIDVFKEMSRILKPGGLAIISFSNRCFFTKAISIWTSTGDADHVMIVGAYFHYAGGFEPPEAVDISPNPSRTDPIDVRVNSNWVSGIRVTSVVVGGPDFVILVGVIVWWGIGGLVGGGGSGGGDGPIGSRGEMGVWWEEEEAEVGMGQLEVVEVILLPLSRENNNKRVF